MKLKSKILFYAIFSVCASSMFGQFNKLHEYFLNSSGQKAALLMDGGVLFGLSGSGGKYQKGTMYTMDTNGANDSVLHHFNDFDNVGVSPQGSLITDGIYFYGTAGPTFSLLCPKGSVFRIDKDGKNDTMLWKFSGADGDIPYSSLIYDGTYLFGTTMFGGGANKGTVFRLKPDGSSDTTLFSFGGGMGGEMPQGALTTDGTFLYGMTSAGGLYGNGFLYKMAKDGSGVAILKQFDGATSGSSPVGSLFYDGTFLYGFTQSGGTSNMGTIFKIMPDGTGYLKLLDFNSVNGRGPIASLISDGTFLYGTTPYGGANDMGTVFKIKPDGTSHTIIHDCDMYTGNYPFASLILNGTTLYGSMNSGSAASGAGSVFKIQTNGTGYLRINTFPREGGFGNAGVVSDGTFLYGTTVQGGENNVGTFYRMKKDGTEYQRLFDFSDSLQYPTHELFINGPSVWGLTTYGGINNKGSIFKIDVNGANYTQLHSFDSINGKQPHGSLISDGTFLYGVTIRGGTSNWGTIFKVMPDGTGFSKLHDFSITDGAMPSGKLYFDGTFLYGMTASGGSSYGTIFKILPDGTGFTTIHFLDGVNTGHGASGGGLISDGTYLYGATERGGVYDDGIVFKILPDGTGHQKLHDMNDAINDGKMPMGALAYDGEYLYGNTYVGGSLDYGTSYKLKTDGSAYSLIIDFNMLNGAHPRGSLYYDGHALISTTQMGGSGSSNGVIYNYQLTPYCTALYTTAYDSVSNNFTLTVDSLSAATATSYHWDFGDGATSNLATPSHIYTLDTVYNVCMTIYTAMGDSCTYCDTIGKDYLGNIIREGGFTLNVVQPLITSAPEQAISESEFFVFPNPAASLITIRRSENSKASVQIYNVIGEKIQVVELGQSEESKIDVSAIPNGIYFVELVSGGGSMSQKVVINR